MARPQFSQMLLARRRDLGLTLEQAARVLKMKEQVLTAFEEGDWDHIPRSGYAQGMLSSYARYLGLNPRSVIDQFKQDLYAYSHTPQPPKRGSNDPSATGERRRLAGYADRYLGQKTNHNDLDDSVDLYGSAGPAGSIMSSGTFDDEMYRRLARERSGHRGAGYSERYLEDSDDPMPRRRATPRRPYTSRMPEQQGPQRRPRSRQTRSTIAASKARSAARTTIQTRRLDEADFQDDLRYDRARPYEAASTVRGRADSRHIAAVERPNVSRRPTDARVRSPRPSRTSPSSQRRDGRHSRSGTGRSGGRRRPDRADGSPGRSGSGRRPRRSAPATPRYLPFDAPVLAIIVAVLFVVFMVVGIVSLNSCLSPAATSEKAQVPVTTAPTDVSAEEEAPAEEGAGESEGTSGSGQTNASGSLPGTLTKAPQEITVSVEDGMVSWVEVVMGDTSLVAETVNGPWEETFEVTGPTEIQASDAGAVRVTADGTPISFDAKASGVGVITIPGPDEDEEATADGKSGDGEGTDGDGTDASDSGDATGTSGTTGTRRGSRASDGDSGDYGDDETGTSDSGAY